jgi:polar amino acid transport system permease protein
VDILAFAALLGGLAWLAVTGARDLGYNWQWYRVGGFFGRTIDGDFIPGPLLHGVAVTLEVAGLSVALALAAGLIAALLRLSGSLSGRVVAGFYLAVVRNTPLLLQIFIFYFVLAPILDIDRFWTGVICLGLFEGAFAAEIFRGGILSVAGGQWEAARALGLTMQQTYRTIVLPQALPLILPPMTGVMVNLVKHSAIVSVIAVSDLATEARNIISDTFLSFEIWLTVAAIYLALTVPLSLLMGALERRFRRQT